MAKAGRTISVVFVGQKNFYTEFLTDWLAQLADLRGVIWTACDRATSRAKARRLQQRIKRHGLMRVVSEVLYYKCNQKHQRKDEADLRQLISLAREDLKVSPSSHQTIEVPNLRTEEVKRLLEECDPDIVLTQCINEIIPESVYSKPKIGCFVYHEGCVPKYRGKFGTFWAIMNREFDQIGASLIKVDRGFDTGKIAFVERVLPAGVGHRRQWWEHEVLYLALPRLKKWFEDVSKGHLDLIDQKGAYPIYSYPRLAHTFKIDKRTREYEQWKAARTADPEKT